MATNGLQLAVHTHPGWSVIVQGPNQNGQYSTWRGQADDTGDATTLNWWWKGDVIVLDQAVQLKVTVPTSDPLNDYFDVYMPDSRLKTATNGPRPVKEDFTTQVVNSPDKP